MGEKLWQTIIDPYWWLTAVLLALLVNVLASYCRDWIDALLARTNEARRKRLERKDADFGRAVDLLYESQEVRQIYASQEQRARFRALFFMLVAFMWLYVALDAATLTKQQLGPVPHNLLGLVVFGLMLFLIVVALRLWSFANSREAALEAAERRLAIVALRERQWEGRRTLLRWPVAG